MRSDNGTNFVGAIKELQKVFQEMDQNQISQYLQGHGANWITWIRSSPTASHMGGVWEKQIEQIRITRSILNALLTSENTQKFEWWSTTHIADRSCSNCQLTTWNDDWNNDVQTHFQLSPSNLLRMKSKVFMPPPGSVRQMPTNANVGEEHNT